ncbi:MAG: ferritin-like domain-containing protein [Ilumatobacteraceae bacterium]|nr:ferritin-like domain-containing protein [Ilumatobacteraceae bacterium]
MTNIPNPSLDRRSLLRNGGIMLSFGAIVAACGGGRSGSDDPGRLGVAAPAPTLPDAELNDGVLLRTAQSLEYTAIAVYDAAAGLDVLSGSEVALVERFVSDHQRHAADLGALAQRAGAEEFTCPNPFIMDRAVVPVLGALEDSDDLHRDVLNIAYAFEALAGASYQALVGVLDDKSLRTTSMLIGSEEHRHAAILATAINPDVLINPVLLGGASAAADTDDEGFPIPYAIPATFGQLTGIELVVGARNEEGARFSTQLQTPADNTFVYDYLSC